MSIEKFKMSFTRSEIINGAFLGTIAQAMWLLHRPVLAFDQSWDGVNYNLQNSSGAFGTITFCDEGIVGVFFDMHSLKSPFRDEAPVAKYDLLSIISGIPENLLKLAQDEALCYLLQEYDGIDQPIITAGFWSEGEHIYAAEDWQDVYSNGAHLIGIQIHEVNDAIGEWQSSFGLADDEVELLKTLYYKKIGAPDTEIVINESECDILMSSTYDLEGVSDCRELLKNIGIIIPK